MCATQPFASWACAMACRCSWDQMHPFRCEGHPWEAEDLFPGVQPPAWEGLLGSDCC